METEQAKAQLARVFNAQPSIREYLMRYAGDSNKTLAAWYAMFADVDEADLQHVVDQIVNGDASPLEPYDSRDQLPVRLKERAKRLAGERRETERMHRTLDEHPQEGKRHARAEQMALIKQASTVGELRRRGKITQQQRDERMEAIQARRDPSIFWDGRHDCPHCMDRGSVLILHPNATQQAKLYGIDNVTEARVCSVACECVAGEPLRVTTGRWQSLPTYDPAKMCRVACKGDRQALVAWLADKVAG